MLPNHFNHERTMKICMHICVPELCFLMMLCGCVCSYFNFYMHVCSVLCLQQSACPDLADTMSLTLFRQPPALLFSLSSQSLFALFRLYCYLNLEIFSPQKLFFFDILSNFINVHKVIFCVTTLLDPDSCFVSLCVLLDSGNSDIPKNASIYFSRPNM